MIAVGTFLDTLIEVIIGALALVGMLTVMCVGVVWWVVFGREES